MTRKRTNGVVPERTSRTKTVPESPPLPAPPSAEMLARIAVMDGRIEADHPMGRVAVIPAGKLYHLLVHPDGRTPDQLSATFARNLIRTAEANAYEAAAAALRDLLGVPSRQETEEAMEEVRRSIDADIERIREELP